MKALIQRVRGARVEVAGEVVGAIDQGLLALVGVEPQDTPASVEKILHKLLNYRVFSDAAGKMNLSLSDSGGGLLLVSQFTLAADTKSGLRPSFSSAAPPALGLSCSTCWSPRLAANTRRSPPASSAPICRCIWLMMGR